MYLNAESREKLIPLKDVLVANFSKENWLELGAITDCLDIVEGHSRLLRSLSWNDEDYPGNVMSVLIAIVKRDEKNVKWIEDYVSEKFDSGFKNISSEVKTGPKICFTPSVFNVPTDEVEVDLVSVMMPFTAEFDEIYAAIKAAGKQHQLRCKRVKDMWEHSTIIQDIFSLIFRSHIVVCDFTGRNPNVFYEAGIAHTLGKHVIPITQSAHDIPFDLQHHRYIKYLNNKEGIENLVQELGARLSYLSIQKEVSIFG